MALRKIIEFGDTTLTKKSRVAEKFDERLAQLIDDMTETMYHYDGCGLAAVQVGILKRVVVIDVGDGLVELVNPEIVKKEGTQHEKEGCLSLPGRFAVTERPMKVQVKAQDRNGVWHIYTGEGLKARAFCHEIDHLDGILFTSHIIPGEKVNFLNCIFMGTPDFSVGCLEKLINSKHNVSAVFSQPDKPVGRKQTVMPTPVKECAVKYNIPVFQPKTLKNEDVIKQIKDFNADIIIVVAYGKILPKEILTSAKHGCINVHASLLPQYRGAAPIQYAVLNGDKETGVTIMQMDEGLDTGDMLLVEKTEIGENETSEELFNRLSVIGANTLIKSLDMIENNSINPIKQPSGDYIYAKMINKSMSEIDWNKSAFQIHNQIRGLQTWPCAQTKFNSKTLKIHKSVLCDDLGNLPGEVMSNKKRLVVSCGDGKCIEILELQLEGKKRMTAKDFLAGNKIERSSIIGG